MHLIKRHKVCITNKTPLSIGTGEEGLESLLLIDNRAVISGTTLAGLFYAENDHKVEEGSENDKKHEIDTIFFYDSFSRDEINQEDIIQRNHVKIDPKTGASADKALFSRYHIGPGQTFELCIEVRGLGKMDKSTFEQKDQAVKAFVSKLCNGEISVGGYSTFGFGLFELNEVYGYKSITYDLKNENDLENYLNNMEDGYETEKKDDCSNERIRIELKASCPDGLLIGGMIVDEKEEGDERKRNNKRVSYHEKYDDSEEQYVIPASSLKGVVRGYCSKILNTIAHKEKEELIEALFGIGAQKKESENNKEKSKRGSMAFYDTVIGNVEEITRVPYNRIKIDRFTGGTINGSLVVNNVVAILDEAPITLKMTMKGRQGLGLMILTLRDMGLGLLPVGGNSGVGYGQLKGKTLTVHEGKEYVLKFEEDGICSDNMDYFQNCIDELNR